MNKKLSKQTAKKAKECRLCPNKWEAGEDKMLDNQPTKLQNIITRLESVLKELKELEHGSN